MKRLAIGCMISAVLTFAPPVLADWPQKPIRIVVPFSPGGATDAVGRLIAKDLTESLHQPVLVVNRPGASTTIATSMVAKAEPDGYTLLLASSSLVLNRLMIKDLPYDSNKDLVPVSGLVKIPHVLVVHPSVAAQSVPELIAMAKAKPGSLNYASTGVGTLQHVMAELFMTSAQVDLAHVPYKGTVPALQDLLEDRVQLMFDNLSTALPNLKSGRLRAIGLTSANRSVALPSTPTLAESGLPGFDAVSWFGIVAPRGTPSSVVKRLNAEIGKILASNEFQERIQVFGGESFSGSPEDFGRFLTHDTELWGQVIDRANIKLPQ